MSDRLERIRTSVTAASREIDRYLEDDADLDALAEAQGELANATNLIDNQPTYIAYQITAAKPFNGLHGPALFNDPNQFLSHIQAYHPENLEEGTEVCIEFIRSLDPIKIDVFEYEICDFWDPGDQERWQMKSLTTWNTIVQTLIGLDQGTPQ